MLRVYISCHNYAAFIGDCLASVARQTEAAFACTVVDDGSTDGSYDRASAAVAGDDRFRVVRQDNAGQLSVFNRAAEEAAPDDLVVFLDADDAWADDHLAIVAAALSGPLFQCDFAFTEKRNTARVAPFRCGVDPSGV